MIDRKWSDISELLTVTVTFSALIIPRNLETCIEMSVMEVWDTLVAFLPPGSFVQPQVHPCCAHGQSKDPPMWRHHSLQDLPCNLHSSHGPPPLEEVSQNLAGLPVAAGQTHVMTVEKWELAPKALVNLWKTISKQHIRIFVYCLTISQMFK